MSDLRHIAKRHPIRVVSARTGLSRDVLRAWELRYGAVAPERTPGGQRLYSDGDIERLRVIQQALDAGRRVGQVAGLPTAELDRLVREDEQAALVVSGAAGVDVERLRPEAFLQESLAAVASMDAEALDSALRRAAVALGAIEFLDHVITPMMIKIGDLWWKEQLSPGHERIATTVVRRLLDQMRESGRSNTGPSLVVATPSGQSHEIGAMLAAAAAAAEGWRVTYMGADLPAASIAGAVEATGARAVALSLIYPTDDPQVAAELRELSELLPADVTVIVGGQGAPSYRAVLEEIGALWLPDTPALRSALDLVNVARGNGRE
jgi:methanogenic corrinoid protein MtbC1